MGKHKQSRQTHHLYLGAGGMLAVAALVVSLTFGLSGAQDMLSPDGGFTAPSPTDTYVAPYVAPSPTDTYVAPPPTDSTAPLPSGDPNAGYVDPNAGYIDPNVQAGTCPLGETGTPPNCSGAIQPIPTGTTPIPTGTQTPTCTTGQISCPALGDGTPAYCAPAGSSCATIGTTPPPTGTTPPPAGTQMPVCTAGQTPTAAVPCLMQGTQQPDTQQPQHVDTGTFWCGSLGRMATGHECDAGDMEQGTRNMGPVMLECPDPYVTGGKTYRPDTIWDWQTQTDKQMTCALWAEQDNAVPMPAATGMFPGMQRNMQFPGMQGNMQFPGQNQPDNTTIQQGPRGMFEVNFQDKCKYNPDDPFCKGGFVQDYSKQYDFNEEDLAQYGKELSQGQVKREMQRLRQELQHIKQNGQEAKIRVAEVQRECNGLAVPIFAEVDAIGDQFNALASDIENLPKDATLEQVQQLSARVAASVKLDKALYGEGPGKFGKMQGLDVGREICWINQRWNEGVQFVTRDIADAEKAGIDVAAAKVVLEKLKAGAANPLKGMTDAGLTFNQLVEKTLSFRPAKKCEAWGIYAPPEFDGGFPPSSNMQGGPGGFGGDMGGFGGGMSGGMGGGQGMFPSAGSSGGFGSSTGSFGGGQGGFGNSSSQTTPGFMPMGSGATGGFDTGMMEKMQQKMMEMQRGSGFSSGFGGAFGGSQFQNSVLTAQRGPMGPGGPGGFGPPRFGPPPLEPPPAECESPVQRLLSPESLMRELGEIMRGFEKHFEDGNKCNMFEIGLDRFEQESGNQFGPPPEVGDLLEAGISACESGDTALIEKIAGKMFKLMRGDFGGDIFETDKLLEDKMGEQLRKKFGLSDDIDTSGLDEATQDYIASLEARVEELAKKFEKISEKLEKTTQALMAVNEKLAALGSAAVTFEKVDLSDVLDNTARLANEDRRDAIADRTNEAVEKLETIRDQVSAENQELVDQVVESLFKSPPSENGAEQIAKLTALAANSCSTSEQDDCDTAVLEDLLPTVLALNTDTAKKVEDGSIPSVDITDNSKWYSPWAANAVDSTLAAAGSDGKLNPEKPAAKQEVAVRACRLADIEFPEITSASDTLPTQAEGVSSWASGCISELEKRGVSLSDLGPLNEPAQRAETAHILHAVLGDKPEFSVDTTGVGLQSDAVGHKYEKDMEWAKAIGAMGAGEQFNPEGTSNRAEDFVIAVNLKEIKDEAVAAE